jgi:hypothetical protein
MSLKIDEVIRTLPENGYNIAESMRKAGYSPSTTRAGSQYAILRKRLEKYYNPERIKADILKAEQDFAKDKDNSNRARMLELRAKILGLTKEVNAGQQVMVSINDTIEALRVKPVDNSKDIVIDATT